MESSLGPWYGGGRRGGGGWDSPFFGSPFSSDIWDPWQYTGGIGNWRRGGSNRGDEVAAFAQANVDWRETDKAHIFRADIPGVRKEDLKVAVEDNNVLCICGDRIIEEEDANDMWHRVERRRGSFRRRFRLPENADLDNIACGLEHGTLTVTVPKKEVQETTTNVRYIEVA